MMNSLDHFLGEIRAYADAVGLSPGTVVQRSGAGGGNAWGRWERGDSSPTLSTVDKILAYIAANPPEKADAA